MSGTQFTRGRSISAASSVLSLLVIVVLSGCRLRPDLSRVHWSSGQDVVSSVSEREVIATSPPSECSVKVVPEEIDRGETISLDSSIETALSNNRGFQAALSQLGMARGDYVQSSLLTNPNIWTVTPAGVKQWEWTLYVPIETLLLRPERMQLTENELERVANQLVQNGIQLARDVKVAYYNLSLAMEQHELAFETQTIREEVAALTDKRFQDGDIAELETIQARVEAINAAANAEFLAQEVEVAQQQLALLIGLPERSADLRTAPLGSCFEMLPDGGSIDDQTLIELASSSRPDVQASNWAIASAERRLSLARKAWWRIDGVADYNGSGQNGPEAGPGLRFDIPIFNKNEGGVMRACAELEAANYNRELILDQIQQQVHVANVRLKQASTNRATLSQDVLPKLLDAMSIARKSFEDGGTDYLLVLQTTAQYVDSKRRMLEQSASACRAVADLEFACGHRLSDREHCMLEAVDSVPSVIPFSEMP